MTDVWPFSCSDQAQISDREKAGMSARVLPGQWRLRRFWQCWALQETQCAWTISREAGGKQCGFESGHFHVLKRNNVFHSCFSSWVTVIFISRKVNEARRPRTCNRPCVFEEKNTQNTQRSPRRPGDHDLLETACDEMWKSASYSSRNQ